MKKLLGAAALIAILVGAGPAEAKQCVWNKGGFVLRIDWFEPNAISWANNPNDGFLEFSFTDQPAQTDVIWAGNGRCINRKPIQYYALLSVCGGSYPSRIVAYPPNWPESSRIDCSIWAVQIPSKSRYLDVWGPVWNPESGEGGPL